jgi:hypothetical protein
MRKDCSRSSAARFRHPDPSRNVQRTFHNTAEQPDVDPRYMYRTWDQSQNWRQ